MSSLPMKPKKVTISFDHHRCRRRESNVCYHYSLTVGQLRRGGGGVAAHFWRHSPPPPERRGLQACTAHGGLDGGLVPHCASGRHIVRCPDRRPCVADIVACRLPTVHINTHTHTHTHQHMPVVPEGLGARCLSGGGLSLHHHLWSGGSWVRLEWTSPARTVPETPSHAMPPPPPHNCQSRQTSRPTRPPHTARTPPIQRFRHHTTPLRLQATRTQPPAPPHVRDLMIRTGLWFEVR